MKKPTDKDSELSPLAAFCERRNISRRDLEEIGGGAGNGASKSQMQRLVKGELEKDDTARLRRILARNLPPFLLSRGMTADEINNELTKIFTKGEYQPMITWHISPKPKRLQVKILKLRFA